MRVAASAAPGGAGHLLLLFRRHVVVMPPAAVDDIEEVAAFRNHHRRKRGWHGAGVHGGGVGLSHQREEVDLAGECIALHGGAAVVLGRPTSAV